MLEEFPAEVLCERTPRQPAPLEGFLSESEPAAFLDLNPSKVASAPPVEILKRARPAEPVSTARTIKAAPKEAQKPAPKTTPRPVPARRSRVSFLGVAAGIAMICAGIATGWWLSAGSNVSAAPSAVVAGLPIPERIEAPAATEIQAQATDLQASPVGGTTVLVKEYDAPSRRPAVPPVAGPKRAVATSPSVVAATAPSVVTSMHEVRQPVLEERAVEASPPGAELDGSLSARLGSPQHDTLPELAVSREAERTAAPAVVARVSAIPNEEPAVRSALYKYQAAYHALDASAAKRVWPAVDERALARAFSGLESQTMTFDSCTINVDTDRARASCTGHTHYVGRVGNGTGQTQSRDWTFQLTRAGDEWRIDSVRTR